MVLLFQTYLDDAAPPWRCRCLHALQQRCVGVRQQHSTPPRASPRARGDRVHGFLPITISLHHSSNHQHKPAFFSVSLPVSVLFRMGKSAQACIICLILYEPVRYTCVIAHARSITGVYALQHATSFLSSKLETNKEALKKQLLHITVNEGGINKSLTHHQKKYLF